MKATIAGALVRLGDSDDTYWHYLVNLALPVVVSDVPDPFSYDAHGKVIGGIPPELVTWAKNHNVPIEKAAKESTIDVYEGLGNLAMTVRSKRSAFAQARASVSEFF